MEKLIEFFGSQARAARAMGVSRPTMHSWVRRGYLPVARAIQAEKLSFGKLQAQTLWGSSKKWL